MKKYQGNLIIEKNDKTNYSDLEEVTGDLYIYSSVTLPKLTSVGGHLYISSSVTLPKLTSVGGDFYISSSVTLPKLTSVGGHLSIYSSVTFKAPKLTSVGGHLSIYSSATFEAPKLTSVGGDFYISSSVTFKAPKLTSVGGNLSIYSSAILPKLTSVGGDFYIYSKISIDLAKRLWDTNRKKNTKWYICNLVPEWLIERVATKNNSVFEINNVELPLKWFNKIRKDELTVEEVFAIDNIEHRRIAYEMMDKTKMKTLKNYKVLDEGIDEKGKKVKLVSFNIQNMKENLIFYNCFDASTNREYWLQMDGTKTWKEAKNSMFGLKNVEWIKEW